MPPDKHSLPPGPGARDWILFAIAMTFVLMGLFLLRSQPRTALMPLTFFGTCAIVFGMNIHRKLRRRRFTATAASVPGGVKLRGSNSRMLLLAGLIGVPAVVSFLMPAPMLIRLCGGIMLATSVWLLFAVLTGRVARRFLRFDPPGLTVGESRYEYFVPWDAISDVAEFEMVDNPCVGFRVVSPDAVVVTPASMRERALRGLAKNGAMSGREVVFMASHFNVPAESLCAALRNYAENPPARAELVARARLAGAG